ncbi:MULTISPECIES: hypothetical protein [Flavobacteriaceae]|uniref:hypothetical protein n=1 Tax=Flavobacteriaceae TaxID=49546 RepID=UPI001492DCAC|nr:MULTISPECIES: hypothetical protein [Allomuricauda]MDC6364836.1 hypothetical protein [Muricauda sp. AC10]
MKKHRITIVLIAFVGLIVNAQSVAIGNEFKDIPQERIYIHHSESLLFSGEHLLYKVYCLDNSQKVLSDISKMAYIALVGSDGKVVFTHKVKLVEGSGNGDFFVPTSVPTGSYKLLGYSEWMKNFGQQYFFQTDIYIINPYQTVPTSYLEQPVDSMSADVPTTEKTKITFDTSPKNSAFATMELDKQKVGKREKVTLKVAGRSSNSNLGDYSISIRKMDSLPSPTQISAMTFSNELGKQTGSIKSNPKDFDIPELRGEIISGTIVESDSKSPAENMRISLSLPGDKFLFNVATSDKDGKFEFIVDRRYDNTTAAVQILSEDWDAYEVVLDDPVREYNGFEFSNFELSKNMKDYILQKSIYNQIENVYREAKLDSIVPANHISPFYRKYTEVYDLDDYTRFNSIPETIVEVVDQVGIRKLDDGSRVFEVRPSEGFTNNALFPMVFVDGLFIKKHEDIMDFSAKKINTISFSREKVLLGSQMFQGIISFKTIEGDFYSDFFTPHIINVDLFKPESKKEYFNQEYTENQKSERTPDFRHQLYWEPNFKLTEGSKEVVFYTSDVPGVYELVLEGFTSTGNPVSVKEWLVVE